MKQPDEGLGGVHSHAIFEEIISLENIFAAWAEFTKGKKKRKDVQQFGLHAEEHLFALYEDLKNSPWRHGGYQSFRVADPKPRVIHKASVRDRIVHHALVRIIEPIFDRSFIFDSWSCRKGKGTHRSVLRFHRELERLSRINRGDVWVLKCDIRKFFASIDHTVLLDIIRKKISDNQTLELIENVIGSFEHGLPLGNLTSQLFANVYMNRFDHFVLERLGVERYMRYSDDFVLVHSDRSHLLFCLQEITAYLTDHLALSIHPNKIHLRRYDHGIDWLGYILYPSYRTVRASTRRRMWKRIDDMASSVLNNADEPQYARSLYSSYRGLLGMSDMRDDLFRLDALYYSIV